MDAIDAARSRTLGQTIRRRRLELGWTQEDLAMRVCAEGDLCHQSDVSRIERGRVGLPRRARLERIAAALEVPLGELLARSGWAGADAAFRPADGPVPRNEGAAAVIEDRPVAPVPPAPDPPGAWRRPDSVVGERLRAAIAQSEELRSRTAELLRASATVLDRIDHGRTGRGDAAVEAEADGAREAAHGR